MFKNSKCSKSAFNFALLCGLLCAVFLSFCDFDTKCDSLRQNVLRLHIIANSDSAEDQNLKLKIRDRLLEESGNIFDGCTNLSDAVDVAEDKLPQIEKIANRVLNETGTGYTASANLCDRYFETRVYDDFTLPAGTYKSLVISLGKSEGKNWWCVIFPEICLPAATKTTLDKTVNQDGVCIAENSNRYILRFKVIEIYHDIKNWIKK